MEAAIDMHVSRITWGAVIAGVIVALSVESLFNLLGIGLGFSALTVDPDVIANIGIGSVIWLLVMGCIAMFAGGWVSGHLAEIHLSNEGMLHGLVTWGLALLFGMLLVALTAGKIISGASDVVGKGIALAGQGANAIAQTATQVVPQISDTAQKLVPDYAPAFNQIKQQAQQLLASDQAKQQMVSILNAFLNAENDDDFAQARQALVNFLIQNTGMDPQQAQSIVNQWQLKYNQAQQQIDQQFEQAKQTAIETTEVTSTAIGNATIITFFVMLAGAIASIFGGMLGAATARAE